MSKIYKIIPPEVKSQILAELAVPGSSVTELARIYQISTTSIYNLQKAAQVIRLVAEPNFIELSVKNSSNAHIKNASLNFANCSLLLEGDIRASSLIAIIKILEEQLC